MINPEFVAKNDLYRRTLVQPFFSPVDGNNRTHNLTNLAQATRTKGLEHQLPRRIGQWVYQPSWDLDVTVTASFAQHDGEHLTGIQLDHEAAGTAVFRGFSPDEGYNADLTIMMNDAMLERQLVYGEPLMVASFIVGTCVQEFFNQTAQQ